MTYFRYRLLLLGITLCSCAGNYRLDEPLVVTEAAQDILRLKWRKRLVSRKLLEYRPQEWASPGFGPDNELYVGSSAGRLLAFSSAGQSRWFVQVGSAIASKPVVDEHGDRVFVGSDDGKMYAISRATGKVLWRYATQGLVRNEPILHEGMLVFTTNEDRVYAVDAATGKWRWQYDRETPEGFTIAGFAGLARKGDVVFSGFSDGVVTALKIRSGEVLWTRTLSPADAQFKDVDTTPVVVGDTVYVASYSDGLFALSSIDGAIRWSTSVEAASAVQTDGKRLFVVSPKIGVAAFTMLGQPLWRQQVKLNAPARPMVYGPYVFVSGSELGLYVVNAVDGQLLQRFDPSRGISAPLSVGYGVIALLDNEGSLYFFDAI